MGRKRRRGGGGKQATKQCLVTLLTPSYRALWASLCVGLVPVELAAPPCLFSQQHLIPGLRAREAHVKHHSSAHAWHLTRRPFSATFLFCRSASSAPYSALQRGHILTFGSKSLLASTEKLRNFRANSRLGILEAISTLQIRELHWMLGLGMSMAHSDTSRIKHRLKHS